MPEGYFNEFKLREKLDESSLWLDSAELFEKDQVLMLPMPVFRLALAVGTTGWEDRGSDTYLDAVADAYDEESGMQEVVAQFRASRTEFKSVFRSLVDAAQWEKLEGGADAGYSHLVIDHFESSGGVYGVRPWDAEWNEPVLLDTASSASLLQTTIKAYRPLQEIISSVLLASDSRRTTAKDVLDMAKDNADKRMGAEAISQAARALLLTSKSHPVGAVMADAAQAALMALPKKMPDSFAFAMLSKIFKAEVSTAQLRRLMVKGSKLFVDLPVTIQQFGKAPQLYGEGGTDFFVVVSQSGKDPEECKSLLPYCIPMTCGGLPVNYHRADRSWHSRGRGPRPGLFRRLRFFLCLNPWVPFLWRVLLAFCLVLVLSTGFTNLCHRSRVRCF